MILFSRRKVIAILSVLLLSAFISISLLDFLSSRSALEDEIVSSSMPLLRESIYSSILRDILPALHASSVMANDNFLISWSQNNEEDQESISRYLNQIVRKFEFLTAFFVSENTSRYYHPEGLHKIVSPEDKHDIWYYSFIDSNKEYDLDVDTSEADDDLLTIFVNFRIEDHQGKLLGVTGVGLEMAGFSGFLTEQQRLYSRQIYLVDDNGAVQAHSDIDRIESENINTMEGLREIAADIFAKTDQPYSGRYKKDGDVMIITSRYIPEIDWFVIVEHSEKEVQAEARVHLYRSLSIGFVTFILVLILSLLTLRGYDRRLQSMAITDTLTGAANRRALEVALPRMLFRKQRSDSNLSLMIIDIDGFKSLNDNFGHQTGDAVLVSFSGCAAETVRPDDLLVRWGGDEFVIATESSGHEAVELANRIKLAFGRIENRVTLSIGLAEADTGDSPESLLKNADTAMYQAKKEGRDRVVQYSADG